MGDREYKIGTDEYYIRKAILKAEWIIEILDDVVSAEIRKDTMVRESITELRQVVARLESQRATMQIPADQRGTTFRCYQRDLI